MIIWHRIKQYRVDRGKDCLHAFLFTLQLLWHYSLTAHHTSSIIPLDSCLRRGYRWYNTTLTRKVLPPITDNMLCRWYTFHHTTHTSPYRREIGKHIWRQRLDAHAGQSQSARFCRTRTISREQTRSVDTENAIAKHSEGPQSTQVPRPVFARSQLGNQPVRDFEVKVRLTRHKIVSAWIVQAPSADKKDLGCHQGTGNWGNIRSSVRIYKTTYVTLPSEQLVFKYVLRWLNPKVHWIVIVSTSI